MNTTERALTACPSKAMSEPFVVRNREVLVAEAPGRTVRLTVFAPAIASKWKPGQFVVVRRAGTSERIPVTIAGGDCASGTIEIVIQEVGKSTADLVSLSTGDEITDVCGPLGGRARSGASAFARCWQAGTASRRSGPLPTRSGHVATGWSRFWGRVSRGC